MNPSRLLSTVEATGVMVWRYFLGTHGHHFSTASTMSRSNRASLGCDGTMNSDHGLILTYTYRERERERLLNQCIM